MQLLLLILPHTKFLCQLTQNLGMFLPILKPCELIALVMVYLLQLFDLLQQLLLSFFIPLDKVFQFHNLIHLLKRLDLIVQTLNLSLVLHQLSLRILELLVRNLNLMLDRHFPCVLLLGQNLLRIHSIQHPLKPGVQLLEFVPKSLIQILELLDVLPLPQLLSLGIDGR